MNNIYRTNQPPVQLQRFFSYARQHGLELLSEDINWITKSCEGMSEQRIRALLMPYIRTWKKHMQAEPDEQKKQNTGRMRANLELLDKL